MRPGSCHPHAPSLGDVNMGLGQVFYTHEEQNNYWGRSSSLPWGLLQLQPISLWDSRTGTAHGRCWHLLSTMQFSTTNFIQQHEALQLFTVGFWFLLTYFSAFSKLFPKIFHGHSGGFLHSAYSVHDLFHASLFGGGMNLLQEIFYLLMTFFTLLFSSGCLGEPFYGLFESMLCICILSPLPLLLQKFHPCVQLPNSEEFPHFSVISLFAVKHCSNRFFSTANTLWSLHLLC